MGFGNMAQVRTHQKLTSRYLSTHILHSLKTDETKLSQEMSSVLLFCFLPRRINSKHGWALAGILCNRQASRCDAYWLSLLVVTVLCEALFYSSCALDSWKFSCQ